MSISVDTKVDAVMRALQSGADFPPDAAAPARIVLTELFSISESVRSIAASLDAVAKARAP